jgi:hypothetical protein
MEQDEEDIFKPAGEEELMQRPGYAAERERERQAEVERQERIAANRQKTERLVLLATQTGFTPNPVDDRSIEYGPAVTASRVDGGRIELELSRGRWRFRREGQSDRLHVSVDQVNQEGNSTIPWSMRPVKVVFDYNRTDDQLVAGIKRRIEALDRAIVASAEHRTQQDAYAARRKEFGVMGKKILGVKSAIYGDGVNYKNGKIVVNVAHTGEESDITVNKVAIADFPRILQAVKNGVEG